MTNTSELERRRVSEAARQLEKQGYKVDLYPTSADLPSILRGYQPDIIARSETETVVVEVRSKETYSDIERFAKIAEEIEAEPGWRFQLIVTNPSRPDTGDTISYERAIDRLHTAEKLAGQNQYQEASLLLAWSAIEPLIRNWAQAIEGSKRKRSLSPGTLAKTAYSLGIVSREELNLLDNAASMRNQLVHGFETPALSRAELMSIIDLGLDIANRAVADSKTGYQSYET